MIFDGEPGFGPVLDDKPLCIRLHGLTSVDTRFHPKMAEIWQKFYCRDRGDPGPTSLLRSKQRPVLTGSTQPI